MPKIKEKRKVLGGRGVVIQHQDGTSAGCYFYRELIKGTKSYKTRKIEGVSSMDEAEQKCVEIAFELNKEPDLKIVIGNNPSPGFMGSGGTCISVVLSPKPLV